MQIAIIGWGSLIWDLEILAPYVNGGWQMGAGPDLPMEFSRVSPKRKMGLAVCLDPVHGVPCRTNVICSSRQALSEAVEDVARRERAPVSQIGWATKDEAHGALPAVVDAVQAWLIDSPYDAAIWTDLDANFESMTGQPFGIAAAIAHLKKLDTEQIAEAHRYIQEAPAATDTPLRQTLSKNAWWQSLDAT